MPGKAALLDIDGTMVDSNDAHAQAWVDTGREFGYDIPFDRVRWLVGMGGDKVLPELTGVSADSETGKQILERRGKIFREQYLPQLSAFHGARELLTRLRADGYQLVVATSASDDDMAAILKQARLDDIIEKTTSKDDAAESKPAPDIVEAALRKAKVTADCAIMLGDTPYDVTAASRAGVAVVALRCGGWEAEDLRGAAAIYDDPDDLLMHYSGSPFSKK